jgi:cytosine/adenosine deaminase-related metal-dependent hydrolase
LRLGAVWLREWTGDRIYRVATPDFKTPIETNVNDSFRAYRAQWIVPVEGRPLEGGYLIVRDDRILSVLPRWSGAAEDLGNVALIPGLVNCHTHLEFSLLTEPLGPPRPFAQWIERVVRYRRESTFDVSAAIHAGLTEAVSTGTTVLGDIATDLWTWDDYLSLTPRPTLAVFQEFLGLTHQRVALQEELSERFLSPIELPPLWIRGFSPHAPYSVHPALMDTIVRYAAEHPEYPVAVHLAETEAERELLADDRGELRELLESFHIWSPGLFGGRKPLGWLMQLAELPRALVVHGNHLDAQEQRFLAQHPHVTLVYCPRTHAAAETSPHPWQDVLEMGGSVALGTDSRATNPDLSLWRELQFLAERTPRVPHHSLLRLGTLAGARALGLGETHGSLMPGKQADVAVVELADPAFEDPVHDLLAPGNRIVGTMIGGEWAVEPPGID